MSRGNQPGKPADYLGWKTPQGRAVWAVLTLGLVLALIAGSFHDYSAYRVQWEIAIAGENPWAGEVGGRVIPQNAYGPLHLVFAPLWAVHPLLPKLIFVAMSAGIFALLLAASDRAGQVPTRRRLLALALLFPLSPAVLITVAAFGINDIVAAFCIVLAAAGFHRGARQRAGIWIGLGALIKFYPLLFAGFLVARGGRANLRVPLVALAVFLAGMAAAYAIWGAAVLTPLQFGQGREAKILSILRFLTTHEALRESAVIEHLMTRNSLYVLLAAVLVALHGWLARLEWEITLLIGILAVFTVYKVGHPQFFVSWMAVQAWILASRTEGAAWRVAAAFLPVAVFLSLFQLVYILSDLFEDGFLKGEWAVVRVYASPVFLAVIGFCAWRARADLFRRWGWPGGIAI